MPMKNPPHPGDLIRTEVIEALGLTVSKAAEILKVRRATLSDLLHGKAALTPEMALRIEKAFGPRWITFSGCSSHMTSRRRESTRGASRSNGMCRPETRARQLPSALKASIESRLGHRSGEPLRHPKAGALTGA